MDLSNILRFLHMCVMLFNICNQGPEARKACLTDMHIWLLPELQRAWDIYTEKEIPYQEEKDKLDEYHSQN